MPHSWSLALSFSTVSTSSGPRPPRPLSPAPSYLSLPRPRHQDLAAPAGRPRQRGAGHGTTECRNDGAAASRHMHDGLSCPTTRFGTAPPLVVPCQCRSLGTTTRGSTARAQHSVGLHSASVVPAGTARLTMYRAIDRAMVAIHLLSFLGLSFIVAGIFLCCIFLSILTWIYILLCCQFTQIEEASIYYLSLCI